MLRSFVILTLAFILSNSVNAGSWSSQNAFSDTSLNIGDYQVKGNGYDSAAAVWTSTVQGGQNSTALYGSLFSSGVWSGGSTPFYAGDGQPVAGAVTAINSTGAAVAVWGHTPSGAFVQYLQGGFFNGSSWTFVGDITSAGTNTRYPSVTLDSSGVATAVWVEDFVQNNVTTTSVRAARSSQGGTWGSYATLETGASSALKSPQVTVDTAGNVTAVWQYDVSSGIMGLKVSRFDPSTGIWSAPVDLISNPNGNFGGGKGPVSQLNLSAAGDGSVYVSWAYGSGSYAAQVARYSAGQWGAPISLGTMTSNGGVIPGPAIATDANGATVAWIDSGSHIQISTCAPNCGAGQTISGPSNPSYPMLALDATGTAMLGWLEGTTVKATIRWGGIWNPTPQTVGSAVTSNPARANIAATGSGNFTGVWQITSNSNRLLTSAQYTSVAPGTPGQPTGVAGSGQATITVSPPNSGDTPTSYTVTSAPGGRTCIVNSSSGSCTVLGLTNGTAYTFTSTASNPAGTSQASQASSAITPSSNLPGTPGAPIAAVTGPNTVEITVTPAFQGAAATGFTVTDVNNSSNTCSVNGASGSCSVSNLTANQSYTFTSQASNSNGTSGNSPTVTVVLAAPSTPGMPTVTAGNTTATVTVMPANSGGTPTTYTVTASPGVSACTVYGPSGSCIVSGLSNGTAYTFTSVATNLVGSSSSSPTSASVTPTAQTPGAPTNIVAVAGNARATVSWAAPSNMGGSSITSYSVTSTPSSSGCTTSGTSCTVSGLTNGTAYTFTSTATNAQGAGTASQASAAVSPSAGPLPSIVGIAPSTGDQVGGTEVRISGANLTGVTGLTFGGIPATNIVVDPNANGTIVTARTPAYAGGPVDVVLTAPSGSVTDSGGFTYAAPPAAPGTPLPAPGDQQVTVSWPQVFVGGGNPTSYTATAYSASGAVSGQCSVAFPGAAFPTGSCTITGLTNGTAYTFTVRATNGMQPDALSPVSAPVTPLSVINGTCGTANNVATMVEPTGFLCSAGSASAISSSQGNFSWSCSGQNGGTTAQCSAPGTPSVGSTQGPTTFTNNNSGTNGCSLQSARMIQPPSNGPGNGTNLPFGVVNFEMTTCTGNAATVRMTFASSVEGMAFWKYVVNSYHNGWVQMPSNQVALVGNTATFTIVDNGEWDNDPTVGAIADPGGPGLAAPGAPQNVVATAGNQSATVSWAAPSSGGAPASYIATANTGQSCTASSAQSSCVISGLTNGTSYTFSVVASNSGGNSAASAASNAVTPRATPAPVPLYPPTPTPGAPSLTPSGSQVTPGILGTGTLSSSAAQGTLFYLLTAPTHGVATVETDGAYSYVSDSGYEGLDSIGYVGCSGGPCGLTSPNTCSGLLCNPGTLYIGVAQTIRTVSKEMAVSGTQQNVTNVTSGVTWNGQSVNSPQFTRKIYVLSNEGVSTPLDGRTASAVIQNPISVNTQTGDILGAPEATPGTYKVKTLLCVNASSQSLLNRLWELMSIRAAFAGASTDVNLQGAAPCLNQTTNVLVSSAVIARDYTFNTWLNKPVVGSVAVNDTFPVGSKFSVLTNTKYGKLKFRTDGSFRYKPKRRFKGVDAFTYTLCEPAPRSNVCAIGNVTLNVGTVKLAQKPLLLSASTSATPANSPVELKSKGGSVPVIPTFTAVSTAGADCRIKGSGSTRELQISGVSGSSCTIMAVKEGNVKFEAVTSNSVTVTLQ